MLTHSASRERLFNYTNRKQLGAVLHAFLVVLVMALFVSPLYISLIYSLKLPEEIGRTAPLSLPKSLYLGNYADVITKNDLFKTVRRSGSQNQALKTAAFGIDPRCQHRSHAVPQNIYVVRIDARIFF